MGLAMMVTICCYCQNIYSCTIHGSIILLKTECIDCEKDGSCAVVENYELFDISHGCCTECFIYQTGGQA